MFQNFFFLSDKHHFSSILYFFFVALMGNLDIESVNNLYCLNERTFSLLFQLRHTLAQKKNTVKNINFFLPLLYIHTDIPLAPLIQNYLMWCVYSVRVLCKILLIIRFMSFLGNFLHVNFFSPLFCSPLSIFYHNFFFN